MTLLPLDVAAAPILVFSLVVPVVIFAVVVGLGVFAVKMIKKISRASARREAERLGASTPSSEESDSDSTP